MSMAKQPYSPVTVGITNSGTLTSDNLLSVSVTGNNNKVYQTVAAVSPSNLISRIEIGIQDPIESFTGREEILAKLHKAIQENKSKGKVTVLSQNKVITGIGVVGKTETIRKYVHTYKSHYGHTLWINAERFSEAKNCFIKIAERCNVAAQDIGGVDPERRRQVIEEIYDILCRKHCLIIFDNAESMGTVTSEDGGIKPFLPPAVQTGWENPAIIVTSRNRDWKQVHVIELPGLSETECYDLLISQLKFEDTEQNQEAAKEITRLCEGLPLVVQQVIGIIQDETEERAAIGSHEFTMQDFLSDYNEGGKDYTNKAPADSPVGASAFQIFKMSFKKLAAKEQIGKLALRFLYTMALLDPDHIPTNLLTFLVTEEVSDVHKGKALALLHKQNLVTQSKCKSFYRIHRVTQLVALFILKDSTTPSSGTSETDFVFRDVLGSVISSFQKYLREQLRATSTDIYVILQGGMRVASHLGEASGLGYYEEKTFLMILAETLDECGKHSDAEVMFGKALKDMPNKMPLICRLRCGLVLTLLKQEKYEDAIAIHEDIIKIQGNSSEVYATKSKLADVFEQRLKLYQVLLKHNEEEASIGPKHHWTLSIKYRLANCFRHKGNHNHAAELYRQLLKDREEVLGREHPQTIATKLCLTNCLHSSSSENDEIVIQLYKEIIEDGKETLGPLHSDVLDAKHNLAIAFTNQGQYEEAEPLFTEVLELRESILRPKHPCTLTTKNHLGNCLAAQGKNEDAMKHYNDVLKHLLDIYGDLHPDKLCTKNNIADSFLGQGSYKEAMEIYEEALPHSTSLLEPRQPDTIFTQNQLAPAFTNQAEHARASKVYEDVTQALKTWLGPTDTRTLRTKQSLAILLNKQGKFEDSVELLNEIMKFQEVTLGADPPDTVSTSIGLENVIQETEHVRADAKAIMFC